MQIKTTVMKFNFTLDIFAKAKNSDNTKCYLRLYRSTGILTDWCWEYKLVQPLWKMIRVCLVMSDFFSTPRTVTHQASLSMGLSQQQWVGCHFLLQGIFLTQGSNVQLLHWQMDSLPLEPPMKPGKLYGSI